MRNLLQTETKGYYSESQGFTRDPKISKRYKKIIEYYEANPERVITHETITNETPKGVIDNEEYLKILYYNDIVLYQDEALRDRLRNLLNSDIVRKNRRLRMAG
jgi:hypothetical protein